MQKQYYTEKDFELIYHATFNSVSKYVFIKTGNFHDAQDIVQNIYYDFYIHLQKTTSKIDNPKAYLIQMANHELADFYKNKKLTLQTTIDQEDLLDRIPEDFDLELVIFDKMNLEKVWETIESIEEPDRSIMIGRFRFDMSYRELAKLYQMPETTVKSRVYKIIDHLKNKFGK